MSRNAPVMDDAEDGTAPAPSPSTGRRRPASRVQRSTWDLTTVGILTPVLTIGLVVGVLGLSQIVYPDPDPPTYPTFTPIPTRAPDDVKAATPTVIAAPIIDAARLNQGLLDKPPFNIEWPEVDDLKLVPSPGRPNEQADYVPAISSIELRKLVSASTVMLIAYQTPAFAKTASDEIAKAYPLRASKQRILEVEASAGYLPDDSIYGVTLSYTNHRILIETVVASPPTTPAQRTEIEQHTLHLGDHILRRLQELASGGRRTAPEAAAVHWRDHITRRLAAFR